MKEVDYLEFCQHLRNLRKLGNNIYWYSVDEGNKVESVFTRRNIIVTKNKHITRFEDVEDRSLRDLKTMYVFESGEYVGK
jgi:hypothetical protein